MAALAIQDASAGLQAVTMSAATAGGDTIAGGSRAAGWDLSVFLLVSNASAAAVTVTVAGTAYAVPAAGIAVVPVYAAAYGTVRAITYSASASVTVAAVRLAPAP